MTTTTRLLTLAALSLIASCATVETTYEITNPEIEPERGSWNTRVQIIDATKGESADAGLREFASIEAVGSIHHSMDQVEGQCQRRASWLGADALLIVDKGEAFSDREDIPYRERTIPMPTLRAKALVRVIPAGK